MQNISNAGLSFRTSIVRWHLGIDNINAAEGELDTNTMGFPKVGGPID